MSNPMKCIGPVSLFGGIFCILLFAFVGYLTVTTWRDSYKEYNDPLPTPLEVLCISETGDTLARYKTLYRPRIWEDSGVVCAKGIKDLETGKTVEIRTRTGTIVCQ